MRDRQRRPRANARARARILILHASVGLGHRRAAEALGRAFTLRDATVQVEDTLDYGGPLFRQLYAGSYLELSEKAPVLWAYFYQRADDVEGQLTLALRSLVDRLGVTELPTLIQRYQPDAVVCTHFLPVDLLAQERRRGLPTPALHCVVTDYTGHVFWAYPEVDQYYVATAMTKRLLAQRGVLPERIRVTGIPVDPAIAEPKDRAAVRSSLKLGGGPVVTLFGTGLSVKRVQQIVTDLLYADVAGSMVVIAGRNAELATALHDLPRRDRLAVRVLGFVENVDDLVTASDLVIAKAGGLIVSEVLARGRPMVVIDPIPGQEEWNADHVVSVSAGVQVRLGAMVPLVVENLLKHPAHRQILEEGAVQAGRPHAALAIADDVLERLASVATPGHDSSPTATDRCN
jgi:processive 1,2-diacylglycerol beta-glucosyltransferase